MKHYHALADVAIENAWLTIGAFDGFHVGHRKIIDALTAEAHSVGAAAVVLTFFPHPSEVLYGPRKSFYLTLPNEKARLLGDAGVDATITYPFELATSQLSAQAFLKQLKKHLGFQHLWVGHDFALGKGREGTPQRLREIGLEMDFQVKEIPAYLVEGEVVSSSRIRKLIENGNVSLAAKLLGRPHFVVGEVVQGEQRGRSLGIPTANLSINKKRAAPQAGVYACKASVEGFQWDAVANVGVRPTFEKDPVPPRIEAHLLGFDGDIYGKQVELAFIQRLRDEQKFESIEALIEQIQLDIQIAKNLFNSMEK